MAVLQSVEWCVPYFMTVSFIPDDTPDSLKPLLAIIENVDSESVENRVQAISRVSQLASKEGKEIAVACLVRQIEQDKNDAVVFRAINALNRLLSPIAVMTLIDTALGCRIALYECENGKEFIQGEQSLRIRTEAVRVLGSLADDRAIIPLMSILNNKYENYRLRLAAAESLGKLGDTHAVKPLIDIISDEREKSVYLKESAVKALGMLGDIRAIEPLLGMLESKRGIRDKFRFLVEQAIEAVGRIGKRSPKVTDSLVLALKDDAMSIRLAAIEALSSIEDPDCMEALREALLDEETEVALSALDALRLMGGSKELMTILQMENLPRFLREAIELYLHND